MSSEQYSRPPRTNVVCFDGTGGQYSSMNTNVVKLFGLLRKDCPDLQAIYYQPGLGTYFAPGVVSPLLTRIASLADEGIAWYLDVHIMNGYQFLMSNYRAGDKICIFGFSRGAYTARALAGMLDKIGLLTKDNLQQVNFAYKMYTRTDKEGIELAAGFKRTFSHDVNIDFLGVWDTVQSTGVLYSRTLPFTSSNTAIRVFRHALSLDERRGRFRPNLYHWPTPQPEDLPQNSSNGTGGITSFFKNLFKKRSTKNDQSLLAGDSADAYRRSDDVTSNGSLPKPMYIADEEQSCTDVLEVWFSGCHSDVGGGNVQDNVQVSLAQIPLHWMVEQVMQSDCGIIFDESELARIGFTPSQPVDAGRSGAQTSNPDYPEHSDAIAPLFDELIIQKAWWILEFLPTANAWQDDQGEWHRQWRINFGRPRFIPYQRPKFHHTVKERMDDQSLKYKPKALHDENEVYV